VLDLIVFFVNNTLKDLPGAWHIVFIFFKPCFAEQIGLIFFLNASKALVGDVA